MMERRIGDLGGMKGFALMVASTTLGSDDEAKDGATLRSDDGAKDWGRMIHLHFE